MKRIITTCLILATLASSAFAQTDFSASAKSRSTAGQFGSDSDDVDASGILDIERTFFSAGYMPQLSGAGDYADTGTMSAFWAWKINDTMTVGLAGEYEMSASKAEGSVIGGNSSGSLASGTSGLSGTQSSWDSIYNGVFTSSETKEYSKFNLRPVFKFGDMAFHYRIYRDNDTTKTTRVGSTISGEKADLYEDYEATSDSYWEHELGFAMNTDAFSIYVPVGVTLQKLAIIML